MLVYDANFGFLVQLQEENAEMSVLEYRIKTGAALQ